MDVRTKYKYQCRETTKTQVRVALYHIFIAED